ncbi:hypothetical protein DC498_15415 [Terrimonas sp.]|uniref:hypothetical protein n=1 Tax=Terrimonas sp. TaxID=1914338 RepID=UPI0009285177|nr:hypothetical protein [Terrimonas sp.]OJY95834.1 MAG: hypothetical protein BGP13_00630 [Sphingobacteriales bacterium 40-81]PVD51268.1 hypothetical protein DC498_15415 [Terrimonas sp.]
MKSILATLFLCACYFFPQAQSSLKIDRSNYYKIIASENLESINTQIEFVKNSGEKYKEAFEGALMMKKAGLLKGAPNKLKEFKAGRQKLEDILAKTQDNAELRFLRLIIQENAPKILGYHKELEEDHKYIVTNFKTIPEATQQAIRDYSKSSKILSLSDF